MTPIETLDELTTLRDQWLAAAHRRDIGIAAPLREKLERRLLSVEYLLLADSRTLHAIAAKCRHWAGQDTAAERLAAELLNLIDEQERRPVGPTLSTAVQPQKGGDS